MSCPHERLLPARDTRDHPDWTRAWVRRSAGTQAPHGQAVPPVLAAQPPARSSVLSPACSRPGRLQSPLQAVKPQMESSPGPRITAGPAVTAWLARAWPLPIVLLAHTRARTHARVLSSLTSATAAFRRVLGSVTPEQQITTRSAVTTGEKTFLKRSFHNYTLASKWTKSNKTFESGPCLL